MLACVLLSFQSDPNQTTLTVVSGNGYNKSDRICHTDTNFYPNKEISSINFKANFKKHATQIGVSIDYINKIEAANSSQMNDLYLKLKTSSETLKQACFNLPDDEYADFLNEVIRTVLTNHTS